MAMDVSPVSKGHAIDVVCFKHVQIVTASKLKLCLANWCSSTFIKLTVLIILRPQTQLRNCLMLVHVASDRQTGNYAIAGTMRPQGRQSVFAGQAGPNSPGQAGAAWLQPPRVFQGSDVSETASTPTRVRQFLKKGVVKFQEVSLSNAYTHACMHAQHTHLYADVQSLCMSINFETLLSEMHAETKVHLQELNADLVLPFSCTHDTDVTHKL